MFDLLLESVRVYNFLFTGLLGLTLIYWILLILGMADIDLFSPEVEPDIDVDADVEMDVDVDADASVAHKPGPVVEVLRFFNVGEVPFMVIFSIIISFSWVVSVLANYYLNGGHSLTLGLMLAGCAFLASLIPAKYLSYPFVLLFRRLESSTQHASIEGSVGLVRTAEINDQYGQIEIDHDGNRIVLNAFPFHDSDPLRKGDQALVVTYDTDRRRYGVSKLNPEDNL